jgi:hypothetical protein
MMPVTDSLLILDAKLKTSEYLVHVRREIDSYRYGVIFVGSASIASVFCWNAFRSGESAQ